MDSCSLEEKMGVARQAALQRLIKAIRPLVLLGGKVHWVGPGLVVRYFFLLRSRSEDASLQF